VFEFIFLFYKLQVSGFKEAMGILLTLIMQKKEEKDRER